MNFTTLESNTVKLKPGDPGFVIVDNLCIVQRAAIEIQYGCPVSYAQMITYALSKGWIAPVAHIKKTEQIFDILEKSE